MTIKPPIFCLLAVVAWARAEDTWRFVTIADWHSAEKYTQSAKEPDWFAAAVEQDVANIAMLKRRFGGDLILMPGDSNGGHWDTPKFIRKFEPGLSPEQSILKAGRLCYSGMIRSFRKGGYSTLLMAVGDHELGDNPWPAGSAVARCQPQFRAAFANELNVASDGGHFLYTTPIGSAPSRPLGTPYGTTSYAARHKSVLFVTIDAFHQEDPNTKIGEQGAVTGTVTGKHLQWLGNVLREARKDADIKHIFVQSHLPVVYPVRKVNSSGMLMDGCMESPFWRLLRRYKVDIYFAGEVHANTATKDPESDLLQLVTRGNFLNNFQTVDITDDRVEVVCYSQKPGTEPSDGAYSVSGRLVIDKSGARTVITGEGEFALLDPGARHLHFTFEAKHALSDNPIMGLSGRSGKTDSTVIRGKRCTHIFRNHGSFGPHYSALTANVDLIDGVRGKAGMFSGESRMGVFAMGPHQRGYAVSYALWLKTDSPGNQVLVNSATCWGGELRNFMNLHLNEGAPEVVISNTQRLVAAGAKLNDGEWHHVAVTMPHDDCKLSDVQIHIDGRLAGARVSGNDGPVQFKQSVRLGFGGLNYSSKAFDKLAVKPFVGAMDEISLWTRSLTSADIRAELEARKDHRHR